MVALVSYCQAQNQTLFSDKMEWPETPTAKEVGNGLLGSVPRACCSIAVRAVEGI